MTELLDASLGPTLDQVMATLRPFVRTNDDGSFVAPKDEALSDLLTLAASMAKSIASRPSAIVEEPMAVRDDEGHEWPARLSIRDTKLHDDMGGGGQRIYTTAGRGYKRVDYVRADTVPSPQPHTGRAGPPLTIVYTNWRGETAERRIVPMYLWHGATEWHPEPQWLLKATDADKGEERDFAWNGIDFQGDGPANAALTVEPETPKPRKKPLTVNEIEKIILSTEVEELSDRGDRIWTRRMAVALEARINSAIAP